MSLILEALKKLEREKEAPERGFLVLSHLPFVAAPKRRRHALALLTVAFLVVAGLLAWRGSRPARPAVTAKPAATTTDEPRPAVDVTAPAPRPRADLPAARPAPAKPAGAAVPSPAPDFRLNAISRQDGKPVAILNDRLVREGDAFDGVRVLRIGEAEVEIEVGGARRVIRF